MRERGSTRSPSDLPSRSTGPSVPSRLEDRGGRFGHGEAAGYDFSVPIGATAAEVRSVVHEYGIAHMEGFLGGERLDRLAAECRSILDEPPTWSHPEGYGLGAAVRLVRTQVDRASFPTLLDVFESPFLEEVVALHYGPGYVFAEQIYVILDVVGTQTIVQQLHYDKVQHLKLFVYLSDVGPGNGPFHCVPRSHTISAQLQADNRANGIIATDGEARVLPPEVAGRQVAVLGGAGTLILFDSDIVHRASVPTDGDRLAVRSLNFGPHSLGRRA